MTTDRFGELRALLQNPPSEDVWREIVDELALWDEGERERVALPYVSDHLDRWPVEITRWANGGQPAWQQRLPNAWDVSSAEDVQALMESERAGRLVALDVRDGAVSALMPLVGQLSRLVRLEVSIEDEGALAALLAARWPKSLRSLKFYDLATSDSQPEAGLRAAEALAQHEALAVLETLEMELVALHDAGVQALAQSPHLRALRTLTLRRCKFGEAGARALADSPILDTVERLDVSDNLLGMGLTALVSSPHALALRTLNIEAVPIGEACAQALVQAPWPPTLEELELEFHKLDASVWGVLADAPVLQTMSSLRLWVEGDTTGAARLLSSPHLSGVRYLSVYGELHDVWEVMCRNPALAGLEGLGVECARLEAAQLELLADSTMRLGLQSLSISCEQPDLAVLGERAEWPALRRLWACGRRQMDVQDYLPTLDDAGVEKLVESGLLAGLDELYLSGNALSDAAALALARSRQIAQLRRLELANNQIGDVGLCALGEPGVLRDIEALGLASNQIGDVGLCALLAPGVLRNIKKLCIAYNQIGDVGATALAQSPHLRAIKHRTPNSTPGGLWRNPIGLAGVLALLRSPYLDPDRWLDLFSSALTHEDIVALAGEPDLARLRGLLWVVPNDAPEETWQVLLDSPYTNQKTRDDAAWNIERLRGRRR